MQCLFMMIISDVSLIHEYPQIVLSGILIFYFYLWKQIQGASQNGLAAHAKPVEEQRR